jgi:hypothetical protein
MQKKPDIKIRKDGADITYENGDKVVFSYTKEKGDFSRYVHHTYLGYLDVEHSFLNAELYEDGKKTLNKKIEVETKHNKSISWSYEDEVKRAFNKCFKNRGKIDLKENLRQYFLEHYYPSKEEQANFLEKHPKEAITVKAAIDIRNQIIENERILLAQKSKVKQ